MGSSHVTEWAKPLVCFFQTIFLHNFCLKGPLTFCQNVEVPCHIVATFFFVWQKANPLNTDKMNFPENFYNMELVIVP